MDAVRSVDVRVCVYIHIYIYICILHSFKKQFHSVSRNTAADGPWSAVSRKLQVTWCVPHELLISTIVDINST